jgi:hypothetical protein
LSFNPLNFEREIILNKILTSIYDDMADFELTFPATTAGICAGPHLLIERGQDYPFQWENYIEDYLVRDGSIITSKGRAFIDFTIEIADYFDGFKDDVAPETKEDTL